MYHFPLYIQKVIGSIYERRLDFHFPFVFLFDKPLQRNSTEFSNKKNSTASHQRAFTIYICSQSQSPLSVLRDKPIEIYVANLRDVGHSWS
jgi:hypothetical protein